MKSKLSLLLLFLLATEARATEHAYKFLLEGDKLTMISDAMIGNLKDSFNSCVETCEDLGTYIGHGELIRYNEEFPKIVYQLKQN